MSIDRQHGLIIISCDTCEETYQGDSGEWERVWPEAKGDGWTARKAGREWEHSCPECAGNAA